MKLREDPKIPLARRSVREPHHSHKFLDVTLEVGLKP
jgi:hypothetical protein